MLPSSRNNSENQQQPSSQSVSTASQTVSDLFGQSSTTATSQSPRGASLFGSSATSAASQGFGLRASLSGGVGTGGGLFGAGQPAAGGLSFQNTTSTASPAKTNQTFGTGGFNTGGGGLFGSSGGFGQTAATPPPAPLAANETIGVNQFPGGFGSNPCGSGFGGTPAAGGAFGRATTGQGMFGQGGGNQGGFGLGFNQNAGGFGQGFNQNAGGFGQGFNQNAGNIFGTPRGLQAKKRDKRLPALDSRARDPCTWLFLVNGGQQTFEEELKVRENFEKLYKVFVSNAVVKAENVVCATGTCGIMCGVEDTIVNACSIGKILTGCSGNYSGGFGFGWSKPTEKPMKTVLMTDTDSVIVIFIGEGWIPPIGYNPPSMIPNAGSLAFFNGSSVRFDGILNLEDEFVAKNTLFICQASYSGNVLQDAAKRVAGDGREMLAMSTGPDHCGSDGSILVDAMVDYFTGTEWKDKTLAELHQFIQEKVHSCTPHYKEMFDKEVALTEEDYESERQKSVQWSTGNYSYHQPSKIPTAAWKMFEQIDKLSEKLNTESSGQITVDMQDQIVSQLQQMKDNKFDLITMFKRKPNYKMNMYGSVDVMGKMKMSDFLHLT